MPLRDLVLFVGVAALVPVMIYRPYVGALAWVFFGLMSPHRLTFGPAFDFPFSLLIAIATLAGIAVTRDDRKMKGGAAAWVLLALAVWVNITTVFALTPDEAWRIWSRFMKTLTMTFVLIMLLNTRRQVELLVAIVVVSIGFYGVKGGLFTIIHGGAGIVNGPEGSVIMGNTELGVATVMIIPLLWHGYQQLRRPWLRAALLSVAVLCFTSILGSYSRGAFLASFAMIAFLWFRSSHRVLVLVLLIVGAVILVPFMPERWNERMATIETYEQDSSAMGRIYAWHTAWNIATDRILGARSITNSNSLIEYEK